MNDAEHARGGIPTETDAASAVDPLADPPADPESVARKIALDLLTAAPRTRAQLATAMARRGVPEDTALDVLDRFTEVGLVDDAAFAHTWVRSRHTGRGLAPRALAAELRRRGVEEPLIADAVADVGRDDLEATAYELVRRRAPASAGLPTDVRVRRLSGMLARKGYSGGLSLRVIRDVLGEESVELDASASFE